MMGVFGIGTYLDVNLPSWPTMLMSVPLPMRLLTVIVVNFILLLTTKLILQ